MSRAAGGEEAWQCLAGQEKDGANQKSGDDSSVKWLVGIALALGLMAAMWRRRRAAT